MFLSYYSLATVIKTAENVLLIRASVYPGPSIIHVLGVMVNRAISGLIGVAIAIPVPYPVGVRRVVLPLLLLRAFLPVVRVI